MTKSKFAWMTVAALTVVVVVGTPAWSADARTEVDVQPEAATPQEFPTSDVESCALGDDPTMEEVGGLIKPRPTCLGSYPNTCDDYPVAVGGSCSCSSQLIQEKCVNCDNRKEGRVLETTCTICGPCYSPPCIPTACIDRVSRTCST